MREETIDIHNSERRLEITEEKVSKEKRILDVNKKYINEFFGLQKARGLKATTLLKDLYSIRFIASHLKKDFKECDKSDIIKICSIIESQKWTEKTKKNHTTMIKKFWKWLYGIEEKKVYPSIVSWVNTNERTKLRKLPEELLTEDEIEKMVQVAENPRDRALLLLAYESGARIGELLNLKIKYIVFNDFGAYVMLNGKTGMRRVTTVMSAPALATFIDHHPFREIPESFLFLTRHNAMNDETKGKYTPLTYRGADKIFKTLAKKARIQKRIYPHLFRHSSATRAAKFLTEAQMKVYYGWTSGSNMPSIYVHLSARDVEEAVKKMNKIPIVQEEVIKATVRICSRCKIKNSFGSKFCKACGYPLDLKTAMEIEEKRKTWDEKMSLIVKDPEIQEIIVRKLNEISIKG